MTRRTFACVAVMLLVVLCAGSVQGEPNADWPNDPVAREHFAKAEKFAEEQRFDEAMDAYRSSYAIEATPLTLFVMAQIEVSRDNCAAAVPLYRAFLERDPPEKAYIFVNEGLTKCGEPEVRPPQPPIEPPEPAAPPQARVEKPAVVVATLAQPRSWYSDRIGLVLVASGGVTLGASVALLLSGRSAANAADDATTLALYEKNSEKSDQRYLASGIAAVAGAVFVAGGVARYLWLAHSESRGSTLSFWSQSGATGFAIAGEF